MGTRKTLGTLADPTMHRDAVDLTGFEVEVALRWLSEMIRIRLVEAEIGDMVNEGLVKTPCHLGIGQEAIAVGTATALTIDDRAFGTHRAHTQYLALGGGLVPMLAEILGRASGVSGGLGGSMHMTAPGTAFRACVPIVGATIPIAAGAALAAKLDARGAVAVAYFGDGAAEEGVFHETLNLASVLCLPIIFVCENNLFASHLDISCRQPSDSIARFADAHHIPSAVVDGNDVAAVNRAFTALCGSARQGQGPGLLEAVTYRWRGHVGPNEDVDVGLRRKMGDLAAWKGRDPLNRLVLALRARGAMSGDDLAALTDRLQSEVREARAVAELAPWPEARATIDVVFERGLSNA